MPEGYTWPNYGDEEYGWSSRGGCNK